MRVKHAKRFWWSKKPIKDERMSLGQWLAACHIHYVPVHVMFVNISINFGNHNEHGHKAVSCTHLVRNIVKINIYKHCWPGMHA